MVKFEGTPEEWLEAITFTRRGYLKKAKTWRHDAYWWEDEKDGSRWFLNWATCTGKSQYGDSVFITARTAPDHIKSAVRQGKLMYIDEE